MVKAVENPMLVDSSEDGERVAAGEDEDTGASCTGGRSRLSPKVAGVALSGTLVLVLVVLAVALRGGGSEDAGDAVPAAAPAAPTQTVLEVVASLPELSTLFTAIGETRITGLFALQRNLTVFAPTNAAFEALSPITRQRIFDPANIEELEFLLKYHVSTAGALYSQDLRDDDPIQTLEGESIEVTLLEGAVFLDQSHGRARVLQLDKVASNGVVHIIDRVLAPLEHPPPPQQSIGGLIATLPELSNFSTAFHSTALVSLFGFGNPNALTVFAPTNEAFAALPAGKLERALNSSNVEEHAWLTNMIQYHIVRRSNEPDQMSVYTADMSNHQRLRTMCEAVEITLGADGSSLVYADGEYVEITLEAGTPGGDGSAAAVSVFVDGARVVVPDIPCHNGVVHIIDQVLEPPHPPGNHLFFRNVNSATGYCGQVDGGPRMKDRMFNQNEVGQQMLRAYINVTLAYDWGGDGLEIGLCGDAGYSTPAECPFR
jgi:uncharacterized surface protein with fasciclin (FAS1) repeats